MDEARELFESRKLRVVDSSDLAVGCFHASDFLFPNLRANAKNARLITELGGSAMIIHTDGPEQVTAGSLDPITQVLMDGSRALCGGDGGAAAKHARRDRGRRRSRTLATNPTRTVRRIATVRSSRNHAMTPPRAPHRRSCRQP